MVPVFHIHIVTVAEPARCPHPENVEPAPHQAIFQQPQRTFELAVRVPKAQSVFASPFAPPLAGTVAPPPRVAAPRCAPRDCRLDEGHGARHQRPTRLQEETDDGGMSTAGTDDERRVAIATGEVHVYSQIAEKQFDYCWMPLS